MSLVTLSRLLTDVRPDHHPVAQRRVETIDFARFRADVACAAARLAGCARVAVVCRDSYAAAVALFAALHAGAEVVIPANGLPATLESLRDSFDRLLDDAFVEAGRGETTALTPLDSTRPQLHFFTSGSTGAPKRISKTLAMLDCELATLDGLWGDELGAGPVLATVSHQHIYGLTFKLLWPLAAGRAFAGDMHEIWETLVAALPGGAVVVASPAHLSRLSGLAAVPVDRRPARIFSAGAPLSLTAAREAEAIFGTLPTEIFGSTETGAIATRRQAAEDQPWSLLPGIAMRTDAEGRLSLCSPFVGPDWFDTSDVVAPTADGFRFLGRADRVVKIEGKRVSLAEVEQALPALPWVAAAAAVLLPGEPSRLAAVVVPNASGVERLSELGGFRFGRLLRRALADRFEPAALPRHWRFVDALPLRAMGKLRDADLLALFGGGA
ncbi:MAG TPA: AMP-binding protein [Patescibacteria group bacterium]|nr:AMP-binding protein [Patescibacteria group bacterium]